jgi:hypothetical protein
METDVPEVEQPTPAARIEEIFRAFEAKGAEGAERAATFLLVLEGETAAGSHLLRISPPAVQWERGFEGDADVRIKLSVEDFLALADGEFDGKFAVASERIELGGDLELAEALLGWIEPEETA